MRGLRLFATVCLCFALTGCAALNRTSVAVATHPSAKSTSGNNALNAPPIQKADSPSPALPVSAQAPKPKKPPKPVYPVLTPGTRSPAVQRLQELLSNLGYLPLTFTPTSSIHGQLVHANGVNPSTLPQPGTWHWRYANTPPQLQTLWTRGMYDSMTQGAVMSFERQNGLAVDGVAGPVVWKKLLSHQAKPNAYGYSYVEVSEALPERLTLWQNGRVILTSLVNTGIPQSPTATGTWPVYLRYQAQTMSGTNPNGTKYHDPNVPWVSYFNGGDAVHGFVRGSYGFPQSLGCVELPPPTADTVWHDIHYGTLVTVSP